MFWISLIIITIIYDNFEERENLRNEKIDKKLYSTKDNHREKAPSNKTTMLTKSMNMHCTKNEAFH